MEIWVTYYAVVGGASATLLGLLFVAVSLNAAVILSEGHAGSKRLAEQAFQNYLAALMISLLALFPSLQLFELGLATLGVSAVWVGWVLVRFYLALTRPFAAGSRWQSLRRQLSSLIGFGMLIVAALRMVFDLGDSRNLFAVAAIILLFSATTVSWELLLNIARLKRPA